MAMMPKRVKHRKSQRGRIKGNATRGNRVVFGDFGLQALQGGWVKAQTIEAGRIAAQQYIRGEGRLFIRIFDQRFGMGAEFGRDLLPLTIELIELVGHRPRG